LLVIVWVNLYTIENVFVYWTVDGLLSAFLCLKACADFKMKIVIITIYILRRMFYNVFNSSQ